MRQYAVVTHQGKITQAIPQLPIYPHQVEELNKLNSQQQWLYLYSLGIGFFDCQVIVNKINWDTDTVGHILSQHT